MKHGEETTGRGRPARRKLPLWAKALLGLAVAGLVFGALELVLALCGVRPTLYAEDPFVGFARSIPLFVEKTGPGGEAVLRTALNKRRYFNLQEFPREKPRGAFRIFCVGGSTTQGSPYGDPTSFSGWLRELLPLADPSREWEVINAGGLSYASYRVAALMEELCRYEPDLFILYTGHNEFLERRTYRRLLETPGPLLHAATWLRRTRTGTALAWALGSAGLLPGKPARPEPGRDILPGEVRAILDNTVGPTDYTRDDAQAERIIAHFRLNLGRMVDIARAAGAGIVLITPASNLRDCSPFKSEHRAGLGEADRARCDALLARAAEAKEPNRLADALAALDEAAAIDPRFADLHFRRGQVLYALGRYPEAGEAFERAIEEDVCPLRATRRIVGIVAEAARERGAPLVDFARLVEQEAEHGIPGSRQFLDHVHPTIAGHRRLALAIVDALREEGIVRPGPSWTDEGVAQVTRKVEGLVTRHEQGRALRNLSKVVGWAGKFEESRRLALQALDLLGDDVESLFQVGVYSQVLGDGQEATRYLQRALEVDPTYGRAHLWLGNVLLGQGKLAEAAAHYRKALELLPDDPDIRERRAAEIEAKLRRCEGGNPR